MLKKIYQWTVTIELLTGLHIGGDSNVDIGVTDSEVIKNPLNNEPYIPGSSLKGKIRYLLQNSLDDRDKDYIISCLFGSSNGIKKSDKDNHESDGDNINISRLIFRDAFLKSESRTKLTEMLGIGIYTEVKAENSINPKTREATPRFIERVPAGAKFEVDILLQVFKGDNEEQLKDALEYGLDLLRYNYLGGNGTRGYGRVNIEKGKPKEVYPKETA